MCFSGEATGVNNVFLSQYDDCLHITGNGNTMIYGMDGNDVMVVDGYGNTNLFGGDGADVFTLTGDHNGYIWGNGDAFFVSGGDDDDVITVRGDYNGRIRGDNGDDVITVTGDGNHRIYGDAALSEEPGDDTITIYGEYTSMVYGGGGEDSCSIVSSDGVYGVDDCEIGPCAPTSVSNSDHEVIEGYTGDIVHVMCNAGYSGGGDAVCGTDGEFSTVTCTANACAPTFVLNSNYAMPGAIEGYTNDIVHVMCNSGYSGGGYAKCGIDGVFSTVTCVSMRN